MANNDQIIGLLMALVAAVGIIVELFLLIFKPASDIDVLNGFPAAQYWALAIPLFLGVFGVLAIVLWIGITMFRTPPPEAWDFEDFEEEFDEDIAADEMDEDVTEESSEEEVEETVEETDDEE